MSDSFTVSVAHRYPEQTLKRDGCEVSRLSPRSWRSYYPDDYTLYTVTRGSCYERRNEAPNRRRYNIIIPSVFSSIRVVPSARRRLCFDVLFGSSPSALGAVCHSHYTSILHAPGIQPDPPIVGPSPGKVCMEPMLSAGQAIGWHRRTLVCGIRRKQTRQHSQNPPSTTNYHIPLVDCPSPPVTRCSSAFPDHCGSKYQRRPEVVDSKL